MTAGEDKAGRFLSHLEPLQGALETFCRYRLNDSGNVSDVLQSAIANAYRDFDRYVEGTNFRAWIFKYLNLEILGRNRRDGRQPQSGLPDEPPVDPESESAFGEPDFEVLPDCPEGLLEQCDEDVARAIRDLGPAEQSVFLLRAVGEFTYREIADALDIPVGTVMSHLSRSRARLRRRLQRDPPREQRRNEQAEKERC